MSPAPHRSIVCSVLFFSFHRQHVFRCPSPSRSFRPYLMGFLRPFSSQLLPAYDQITTDEGCLEHVCKIKVGPNDRLVGEGRGPNNESAMHLAHLFFLDLCMYLPFPTEERQHALLADAHRPITPEQRGRQHQTWCAFRQLLGEMEEIFRMPGFLALTIFLLRRCRDLKINYYPTPPSCLSIAPWLLGTKTICWICSTRRPGSPHPSQVKIILAETCEETSNTCLIGGNPECFGTSIRFGFKVVHMARACFEYSFCSKHSFERLVCPAHGHTPE